MNKKRLRCISIFGFFFVSILGSFAHFFYGWSGNNSLVALFTPINESTWEHMKLLFFPGILYTWYITKCPFSSKKKTGNLTDIPNILFALLKGVLIGTCMIPVLFYTYTGILGYNIMAFDIGSFFVSVLIAFLVFYRSSLIECNPCYPPIGHYKKILIGLTILFCILFFVFTLCPPDYALFISPVN